MKSLYIIAIIVISNSLFSSENYMLKDYVEEIKSINKPKSLEAYKLEGLFFSKDEGTFTFDGTMYFIKNFRNSYKAAYFKGNMNFSLYPPVKYEREQLKKEIDEEFFDLDTEEGFFFFTDDFYEQIKSQGTKIPTTSADKKLFDDDFVPELQKYFIGKKHGSINPILADAFLNYREDFFLSAFKKGIDYWFYQFNADDNEEVSLMQGYKPAVYDAGMSSVCVFDKTLDYQLPAIQRVRQSNVDFDITEYDMDLTIDEDLILHADVEMNVKSDSMIHRWTVLRMDTQFDIDSIWVNGKETKFKQTPYGLFYVYLGDDQEKEFDIRFKYKGKVLNRRNVYGKDVMNFRSFTGWYPTSGLLYYEPSVFKMKFKVPKNFKFVAPGKHLSESEDDEWYYSEWITDGNAIHTTFSMGPYKKSVLEQENGPDIELYFYNYGEVETTKLDLAQSYEFYSNLYGELGYEKLYATEIYSGHGQAFSNFLHLSYANFDLNMGEAEAVSFVSHEMAHQWWGGGLKPLSGRDTWISEGFAEYSSHLYTQLVLKDNDEFFKLLDKKKDNLITSRRKSEDYVPALCMGNRAGKTYTMLVYEKGCWIQHMIRQLLINPHTFNEDAYKTFMKSFFEKYKFKRASNEDFKAHLDQFTGSDTQWFFDQWIYGSEIPRYIFSYKVDETPEGKYLVTCKVIQEEVSDGFQMPVLMKVDMGKNGVYRLRANIGQKEQTFQLPLMPFEPEEVIFNDLNSVLCEVEEDRWED